jgi:hypothetical protein
MAAQEARTYRGERRRLDGEIGEERRPGGGWAEIGGSQEEDGATGGEPVGVDPRVIVGQRGSGSETFRSPLKVY